MGYRDASVVSLPASIFFRGERSSSCILIRFRMYRLTCLPSICVLLLEFTTAHFLTTKCRTDRKSFRP